mmetsp:Transcript_9200/g.27629  ORF Transcript_9200/g.27629 Transcript_9200/m.27629 type:complete len:215 (-) Transcript_9200:800-1444(-)
MPARTTAHCGGVGIRGKVRSALRLPTLARTTIYCSRGGIRGVMHNSLRSPTQWVQMPALTMRGRSGGCVSGGEMMWSSCWSCCGFKRKTPSGAPGWAGRAAPCGMPTAVVTATVVMMTSSWSESLSASLLQWKSAHQHWVVPLPRGRLGNTQRSPMRCRHAPRPGPPWSGRHPAYPPALQPHSFRPPPQRLPPADSASTGVLKSRGEPTTGMTC